MTEPNSTEVIAFRCPDCMGTGKEKSVDGSNSVQPCGCDGGIVMGFVKVSTEGGLRHVFQLISDSALALCGHQISTERTFEADGQPPCLPCFYVLSMLTSQNDAPVDRWSSGIRP
ncbi:MAG: hypothetical protein WBA97_03855 [Actinophytocola sp.]|uniref:hypothetical protein n=1 Tax=Actinophytocola sp. TaxID=1872138 RepID=UPI003C74D760